MPAPIGSIVAYAGPVDADWETTNGWMACDGRQLDRTDPAYTPLWEAIGYIWGGDTVRRFRCRTSRSTSSNLAGTCTSWASS